MGITVLFVLCVLSMPAFGAGNAVAKPRSCTDVKQFYTGKGFSPSGLPQSEISGEHLRVCPQGYTCCTSEMEEKLTNLSRVDFERLVKEEGRSLQITLNTQYKSFDSYVLELINHSEASLPQVLGAQFEPNQGVLQDLFADLRRYYRGSNINLEESLNEFWLRLLERLFKAANPEFRLSDDYLECVTKQSETLQPFGETPRDSQQKVTRAFVAMRTFIQGLVTGGEVTRRVSQVPLSQECERALMKLSYCPQCQGMSSAKPCRVYCHNVLKGCLANQADLNTEWRNLADAMLKIAERIKSAAMDRVIQSVPIYISEGITYLQENQPAFRTKVIQACGPPTENGDASAIPDERPLPAVEKPSTTASPKSEKLVNDVSDKVRSIMDHWVILPSRLCADRVASGTSAEDSCWNGQTKGRYLPEMMGDGLASQINNPEVEIDITKPDMNIRQQIMQLKIMTNRLKNALNGNDVDFQDTSDDVSGSGSGGCSDDLCGPTIVRETVPKTDLAKTQGPHEGRVRTTGAANQSLPSIALCLLSLVTLLLLRR
ncbi:glypican-1b [Engraulis encrasicolus]|uniref:glypican-1b n=1 Tax=Engraulis encrasicolus TaxID=184585 RepID=UPI002FD044F5